MSNARAAQRCSRQLAVPCLLERQSEVCQLFAARDGLLVTPGTAVEWPKWMHGAKHSRSERRKDSSRRKAVLSVFATLGELFFGKQPGPNQPKALQAVAGLAVLTRRSYGRPQATRLPEQRFGPGGRETGMETGWIRKKARMNVKLYRCVRGLRGGGAFCVSAFVSFDALRA